MAAAAFTIAMAVRNAKGQKKSVRLTVSDVAAAFALWPSGESSVPLSSVDSWVEDMIFSAAGTDTTQLDVIVNGIDTGMRVANGANLATGVNRQIQGAPIFVPAGALLRFIQRA